jgi:hypothetical protein
MSLRECEFIFKVFNGKLPLNGKVIALVRSFIAISLLIFHEGEWVNLRQFYGESKQVAIALFLRIADG